MPFMNILIFVICILYIVGLILFAAGSFLILRAMFNQWSSLNPQRKKYLAAMAICIVLFNLGIDNFAAFFVVTVGIGGDAFDGKIVGDKYYVVSHGKYTEVARGLWLFSWYHMCSNFVTGTFIPLSLGFMVFGKKIFGLSKDSHSPPIEDADHSNDVNNFCM
jgi:hypothetical protein